MQNCSGKFPIQVANPRTRAAIIKKIQTFHNDHEFFSYTTPDGTTLLHRACHYGWLEIVEAAIDCDNKEIFNQFKKCCGSGMSCKIGGALGPCTPLHTACAGGHLDVVKAILRLENATELMYAESNGVGLPAVHAACWNRVQPQVVEALLERSDSREILSFKNGRYGDTILHIACRQQRRELIEIVFRRDDLHDLLQIENDQENSPLADCGKDAIDVILSMENAQQILALQDLKGRTLLHYVCASSSTEHARAIIERSDRSMLKLQAKCGATPFHVACAQHAEDIMECFFGLKDPELLSIKDNDGHTPMDVAYYHKPFNPESPRDDESLYYGRSSIDVSIREKASSYLQTRAIINQFIIKAWSIEDRFRFAICSSVEPIIQVHTLERSTHLAQMPIELLNKIVSAIFSQYGIPKEIIYTLKTAI